MRTLAFDLHPNYDALPGQGTADKARELVEAYRRQGRLGELLEAVLRERPHLQRHAFLPDSRSGASPFKGLPAFEEADAGRFFGREALTARLLEHLRERRFLAVVGASGSGKSSVVRAGLIPAVRARLNWPVHLITPTAQPLEALATTLTRHSESVTATATLIDDLRRDARSLHLYAHKLLGDRPALLLVVDQFEELFTLCRDESEREAFVASLVTAVAPGAGGPIRAVITLRADFYNHCLAYPRLHALLEAQQRIVGPMSAEELRQAIELPAQRQGLTF